MAKLILSMDGLRSRKSRFQERTTIGRKPHNDIQIDTWLSAASTPSS